MSGNENISGNRDMSGNRDISESDFWTSRSSNSNSVKCGLRFESVPVPPTWLDLNPALIKSMLSGVFRISKKGPKFSLVTGAYTRGPCFSVFS